MSAHKEIIAIVGAGSGGADILTTLLQIPDIEIGLVCDSNPNAPGIKIAQRNDIPCSFDPLFTELKDNPKFDLILELTGVAEVFKAVDNIKHNETSIIGAAGNKLLFGLIDEQDRINNNLAAHKESLESTIAQRTAELETANTKLRSQLIEHERLNEKLQQINNQKTKYLLQSTHQLKAPFAAIQSYTDIIIDGYTGEIPDKTRAIAMKIKVRCELLSKSIKGMLKLANLKSYVTENVKKKSLSLSSMIQESIDNEKVMAEKKNVSIIFTASEKNDEIYCIPDQLSILFNIILENAVTYSHDDSDVEISIQHNDDEIIASFTDHGIGISEKNLENIYKEYFRSNRALAHHQNGTGLGLPIAKRIADIHQFELKTRSVENEGTTIDLIIPAWTQAKAD